MKKFILFVLTLMLIASMAVPAFAATPSFEIPEVPQISKIKFDINFEFPENFWDNWFEKLAEKQVSKIPGESDVFTNRLKGFID